MDSTTLVPMQVETNDDLWFILDCLFDYSFDRFKGRGLWYNKKQITE